jgi:hydroxyethylthiazole kinase-like uncharacterized protein yjeF
MTSTREARNPAKVNEALLRAWPLPLSSGEGDKEERGKVLMVAGSSEMPGAAILAANAALRVGAGKVTIATVRGVAPLVALAVPEARVVALAETSTGALSRNATKDIASLTGPFDVVLAGPGMVASRSLHWLVAAVAAQFPDAMVILDAGAMELLGDGANQGRVGAEDGREPRCVVTPHAGEMARLADTSKAAVEADPLAAATRLARTRAVVAALKGAVTFIADPAGQAWTHDGRNIGLAMSGSGDVLAGAIAGLAARGAPPAQAAV